MEFLSTLNKTVSALVWGPPMLALMLGTGLYLSARTGFLQFRKFGPVMKNTLGKIFTRQKAGTGSVTPFQAVSTALAGTAGTGNIAGITLALCLGGPGSLFWLWVTALIGMATKYAEVTLAIRFRERNAAGDWVGGTMYTIKNGLGRRWAWLGGVFCVFCALAAFGMGNAVQVGNISAAVQNAAAVFLPGAGKYAEEIGWAVGLIVAVFAAVVLLGGVKRLGRVTETLIPLMSLVYIICCLAVLLTHTQGLGHAVQLIFRGAFDPKAAFGGVSGFTVSSALSWGLRRGVFTNEAGLGSAPMAHAASSETNPVKQGYYGIFEVFIDTIVLCTLTGLSLLASGVPLPYGQSAGTEVNAAAFATVFGEKAANLLLAVSITVFAAATVLSWGLYGARCAEYLLGSRAIRPYQLLFSGMCVLGAVMKLDLAWALSDTFNGLMALPNLVAVLCLSGLVAKLTRRELEHL
ncbi:MAG: sodium:alanine symporter family protein [Firmicutes bacterium]|nr:sodium:alanine symporter family protein [Bacillota bacterium]